MYTEPLKDFDVLICSIVPFGTCSWCLQLHTAIIAVWHFILTKGQYVIVSRNVEYPDEPEQNTMSHSYTSW